MDALHVHHLLEQGFGDGNQNRVLDPVERFLALGLLDHRQAVLDELAKQSLDIQGFIGKQVVLLFHVQLNISKSLIVPGHSLEVIEWRRGEVRVIA